MSFPKNFDREKVSFRAQEIRRKIERGDIKIEYAKSTRTERIRPWISKVLEAVGHPEAFVTDESKIGDFFSSDEAEKAVEIAKKLGVSVAMRDHVVDVANRIRVGHMS